MSIKKGCISPTLEQYQKVKQIVAQHESVCELLKKKMLSGDSWMKLILCVGINDVFECEFL